MNNAQNGKTQNGNRKKIYIRNYLACHAIQCIFSYYFWAIWYDTIQYAYHFKIVHSSSNLFGWFNEVAFVLVVNSIVECLAHTQRAPSTARTFQSFTRLFMLATQNHFHLFLRETKSHCCECVASFRCIEAAVASILVHMNTYIKIYREREKKLQFQTRKGAYNQNQNKAMFSLRAREQRACLLALCTRFKGKINTNTNTNTQ